MLPNNQDVTQRPPALGEPNEARPECGESLDLSQIRRAVHDLKNWIAGIKLVCDGALMPSTPLGDLRSAMEHIQAASLEAACLCERILATGNDHAETVATANSAPGEALASVRNLVEGTLPEYVKLRWEIDADVGMACGKIHELNRAVLNLLNNAVEALNSQPGCITVKAQLMETEDRRDLMIEVEDNGCGMDGATRSHVFDSNFTTKPEGHGLGLASVREIVEAQHGRLEIDSQPGQGTRVRIWFPCETSQEKMDWVFSEFSGPREEGQRILWVDDDRTFREIGRALLESRGFEVSTHETTHDALEALVDNHASFSVILLDMHLPGLAGAESFERLRRAAPQLPIIIVSGSTPLELSAELGDQKADGYLEKPFNVDGLVAAIHKATAQGLNIVNS